MGVSRGTADLPSFHSLARTKKTRHKPAGELIFRLLGGNDFILFYFNAHLRFMLFMNAADIENIRCTKKKFRSICFVFHHIDSLGFSFLWLGAIQQLRGQDEGGGEGGKKGENSVHGVVECPLMKDLSKGVNFRKILKEKYMHVLFFKVVNTIPENSLF
jgi:hypothetical protein